MRRTQYIFYTKLDGEFLFVENVLGATQIQQKCVEPSTFSTRNYLLNFLVYQIYIRR